MRLTPNEQITSIMGRYKLKCEMMLIAHTEVEADSLEEAIEIAEERYLTTKMGSNDSNWVGSPSSVVTKDIEEDNDGV